MEMGVHCAQCAAGREGGQQEGGENRKIYRAADE